MLGKFNFLENWTSKIYFKRLWRYSKLINLRNDRLFVVPSIY